MSISSVLAASLTAADSGSSKSADAGTAQFLDIFLTQLQHQSPLEPMDTSEFTSQIAQYSSLEQQLATNAKLDSLLQAMTASVLSPMSYLGNRVTFESDTSVVQDGSAQWLYSAEGAASVQLTVTDAAGNVVYSGSGDAAIGLHGLTLDAGSNANGAQLTLTVTAYDSAGESVGSTVYAQAMVDAIDSTDGTVLLEASGFRFSADSVTRIATPAAAETVTPTAA